MPATLTQSFDKIPRCCRRLEFQFIRPLRDGARDSSSTQQSTPSNSIGRVTPTQTTIANNHLTTPPAQSSEQPAHLVVPAEAFVERDAGLGGREQDRDLSDAAR